MWETIVEFILAVPQMLIPYLQLLSWEIPYLGISFMAVLTFGGFTTIFVLHVVHLVNVVSG